MARITALHRWIGLALALVLVSWTVTGLLFHLKPGWPGAYEMLDPARRDAPLDAAALQSLPAAAARVRDAVGPDARITDVTLTTTVLGPVYRVGLGDHPPALVDARSGQVLSPLAADAAIRLAADAAARSGHPERYGDVTGHELGADAVTVAFAGGARVRVSRHDAAMSQRGPDTDRIDRYYRLHYLQLTGHRAIDRTLAICAIVATWLLAALGIALFIRQVRRR